MKRIVIGLLAVAALSVAMLAAPVAASAQVYIGISVGYAPPLIPVYAQPACPGAGYVWTPGYWAWGPYGYYWVPGTWVLAPAAGLLWTPGYWAWNAGLYWWQPGYWGPTVGFYGGIDYGYGYPGDGYFGGYWRRGAFFYNRTVTNVDVTYIHNTYNQTVISTGPAGSRVSYNGGYGGIHVRPSTGQWRYAHERHFGATDMQLREERLAMNDPRQRFDVNRGRPEVVATVRPSQFRRANAMRMGSDQTDHMYHSDVYSRMPDRSNVTQVVREPQSPAARPYTGWFRTRSPVNVRHTQAAVVQDNRAAPMSARNFEGRPQPQASGFRGPPVDGYRPPMRPEGGAWHETRTAMPRPEQFHGFSARPAFRSAPHFEARAVSRNPGHPGGGHPGGRPR